MEWHEEIKGKISSSAIFDWDFKLEALKSIWSNENLELGKLYYFVKNSKYYIVRIIDKYKANKTYFYDLQRIEIIEDIKTIQDNGKMILRKNLKGLKNVVDDNEYFSKIPLPNSIFHFDNGICFFEGIEIKYKLNNDKNKWDKFEIEFEYDFIPEEKRKEIMMIDGHENPER